MATIALLGTLDTKLNEFLKLRELLVAAGATDVILIDAGRVETTHSHISISQPQLLKEYSPDPSQLPDFNSAGARGDIVSHMSKCATSCVGKLFDLGRISGIISAGGSGGTSLATAAMRALPMGFPKVMVSTVGSGDTSPFVGETDICMIYSVVDVAGWNGMLEKVFSNAAATIVGMAKAFAARNAPGAMTSSTAQRKRRIGITMFGVTTPCVDMVRDKLVAKEENEVYVFHATGHGGRAMERLVNAGELDAVIDLTTTEICDHFMGGNMSAGPNRLEAALVAGIPCVISVGACDMVNFGAKSTVPEKYKERRLYEHNPAVTVMRTTPAECRQIAGFICDKIENFAKRTSSVKIILPEGGVSLVSAKDQVFQDTEADQALFEIIRERFAGTGIDCINRSEAINDPEFATAVVEALNHIRPS